MSALITAFLVEHPRSRAAEIADALGVSAKALGSTLSSLRRHGKIVRDGDGRWQMAPLIAPPVVEDQDLDLILDALGLDRQLGLTEAIDEIARLRSPPPVEVIPTVAVAPAWPMLPAGWEYVAMRKVDVDDNERCVVTPMVTLRSRP